jgi:hypothetical protein
MKNLSAAFTFVAFVALCSTACGGSSRDPVVAPVDTAPVTIASASPSASASTPKPISWVSVAPTPVASVEPEPPHPPWQRTRSIGPMPNVATQGTMREAEASVTGRLPPDVVKRILRAQFGEFRRCYTTALARDPSLSGVVRTKSFITASGGVTRATIATGTTLADASFHACLLGIMRKLSYPNPVSGEVEVIYAFEFTP